MDPIVEVVTLIRRQAELELALIHGDGTRTRHHATPPGGPPADPQRRITDRAGAGTYPR